MVEADGGGEVVDGGGDGLLLIHLSGVSKSFSFSSWSDVESSELSTLERTVFGSSVPEAGLS